MVQFKIETEKRQKSVTGSGAACYYALYTREGEKRPSRVYLPLDVSVFGLPGEIDYKGVRHQFQTVQGFAQVEALDVLFASHALEMDASCQRIDHKWYAGDPVTSLEALTREKAEFSSVVSREVVFMEQLHHLLAQGFKPADIRLNLIDERWEPSDLGRYSCYGYEDDTDFPLFYTEESA